MLIDQGGGAPIYPVLRSSSSVKVKVKSQAKNSQLVKERIDTQRERKYTRIRSKVKCKF